MCAFSPHIYLFCHLFYPHQLNISILIFTLSSNLMLPYFIDKIAPGLTVGSATSGSSVPLTHSYPCRAFVIVILWISLLSGTSDGSRITSHISYQKSEDSVRRLNLLCWRTVRKTWSNTSCVCWSCDAVTRFTLQTKQGNTRVYTSICKYFYM